MLRKTGAVWSGSSGGPSVREVRSHPAIAAAARDREASLMTTCGEKRFNGATFGMSGGDRWQQWLVARRSVKA